MTQILTHVLTPIVLAIMSILGSIYLKRMEKNYQQLAEYFNINQQNKEDRKSTL